MLLISLVASFSAYEFTGMISLHPWIEFFTGGLLSVLIYFVGIVVTKALTKQDYTYLLKLSDSFGPFSNVFRRLVNVLISFS